MLYFTPLALVSGIHSSWRRNVGGQIGHNQTVLVKNRRQKWHATSCPTSNGILVMLDLLEFSDWQPAEAMVEAYHLSSSRDGLHHF